MADFSEAEWYENNSPSQWEDGLKHIKLVDPKKGDRVLDFGCGTGNLTKVLADLVGPEGKVVGVDPDRERLQLARKKYPGGNLEYVEGSAEAIPGDDYDIVFSNHAIHYCMDKEAVFKQLAAKLKKGGKFAYIANVEDEAKTQIQCHPEFYGKEFRDFFETWYHYTDADEYMRITTANNFKITHTESLIVKFTFNGVKEFVDFRKTHAGGRFDDSQFNLDAMKQHYNEGPFSLDVDYLLVMSTYEG